MGSDQESENKSKFADKAVTIGAGIGALIVGRLFGLVGVGAIALGWVAYTYSKVKVGTGLGILVGVVAALAGYGLAIVALATLAS